VPGRRNGKKRGNGNKPDEEIRKMQWYNYLGWTLVGIFILFFGVGWFVGIDKSMHIIPILVILALGTGVVLVNKY
jgi:hypothetical protein